MTMSMVVLVASPNGNAKGRNKVNLSTTTNDTDRERERERTEDGERREKKQTSQWHSDVLRVRMDGDLCVVCQCGWRWKGWDPLYGGGMQLAVISKQETLSLFDWNGPLSESLHLLD